MTVVVPVYNAGEYLDRCAPSLLGQSLGPQAYEVIYVDDGSTDGSGARLDRLAAAHSHVRVVHQENSGWPGRPRNVGMDLARGDYIQFVDQDDELGPEALQRLHAVAAEHGSDVVIGKMAGSMIGPRRVFRDHVPAAALEDTAAIETITGHKMFRRAFLEEHSIRFPEGYWRGEDLLFVTRAYARCGQVSIVADYPCYYWHRRDDGGNHSTADYDLEGQYDRLRTIVAAAVDGTAPGGRRDLLLTRLFRVETLGTLEQPDVRNRDEAQRRKAFELCRDVAREAFPAELPDRLHGVERLRARLLVDDRPEEHAAVGAWARGLKASLQLTSCTWDGSRVRLAARFGLRTAEGEPLTVVEAGHGFALDASSGPAAGPDLGVGDPLATSLGDVALHDREGQVWWWAPGTFTPQLVPLGDGRHEVVLTGEALIDPAGGAAGRPLAPGRYEVWFSGQVMGIGRRPRVRAPKARPLGRRWVGRSLVDATWSGTSGQLVLEVHEPVGRTEAAIRPAARGAVRLARAVRSRLP